MTARRHEGHEKEGVAAPLRVGRCAAAHGDYGAIAIIIAVMAAYLTEIWWVSTALWQP